MALMYCNNLQSEAGSSLRRRTHTEAPVVYGECSSGGVYGAIWRPPGDVEASSADSRRREVRRRRRCNAHDSASRTKQALLLH